MSATLQAINRFPVKSCRGQAMTSAIVERQGLAGDRRWMIVDEDAMLITAREYGHLLLVVPTLHDDGSLDFVAPDMPPLHVPVPDPANRLPVYVWKTEVLASVADDAAHAWFSKVLGKPARLVHLDDTDGRRPSQDRSRPDDRVSFADGYPLLAVTTGSMDALNDLIAAGPRADEGPLPVIRFRPNVVIDSTDAWAEDGWRRLRIGEAYFRAVKGCDRCVMTLVDPVTAARGKEPIATLARHRRWDGATWFGMDLIPDNPGAAVHVGDDVEILESVPAPDGPPR
ncbi:MOSC domain-containing protein [uncultured Jatrophihabitans sp.]|uniref:MOSC domain-containing protein n=1 Tax=uncultured Jatrophihabitans sp. TaxID=1610747 RepID=UPI0035CABB76